MPQVSVVVPAFNAQETLRDTLRSAAASTYREIEIIVVDDGSTDGTLSIAQDFAERDSRIRTLRRENGGPSAALNSGLAVAKGDYVARLDSDDLWHPSKLENQVNFARSHPDVAFIYTFARYIDADSRVLHDGPAQSFPRWALCRGICESLVGVGSSALIKRTAVEEAGGCDESLRNWEDLLLQLAVSARHPVGFVPSYLVGYRIRPQSLSKDIDTMLEGWRAVRSKLISEFHSVPDFVHAWAHGGRCAMFAEGYAWRGRYFRSTALLLEALRHDPAWTFEFLRFRLARRANKPHSRAEQTDPFPYFCDCNPAQRITVDWFQGHPAERRFAEFENERLRVLAEVDERLAGGYAARREAR